MGVFAHGLFFELILLGCWWQVLHMSLVLVGVTVDLLLIVCVCVCGRGGLRWVGLHMVSPLVD